MKRGTFLDFIGCWQRHGSGKAGAAGGRGFFVAPRATDAEGIGRRLALT